MAVVVLVCALDFSPVLFPPAPLYPRMACSEEHSGTLCGFIRQNSSNSISLDFEPNTEYRFVEQLEERYKCAFCHSVLHNPHQTGCGHRFCQHCIVSLRELNTVPLCPVDKEVIKPQEVSRPLLWFSSSPSDGDAGVLTDMEVAAGLPCESLARVFIDASSFLSYSLLTLLMLAPVTRRGSEKGNILFPGIHFLISSTSFCPSSWSHV